MVRRLCGHDALEADLSKRRLENGEGIIVNPLPRHEDHRRAAEERGVGVPEARNLLPGHRVATAEAPACAVRHFGYAFHHRDLDAAGIDDQRPLLELGRVRGDPLDGGAWVERHDHQVGVGHVHRVANVEARHLMASLRECLEE